MATGCGYSTRRTLIYETHRSSMSASPHNDGSECTSSPPSRGPRALRTGQAPVRAGRDDYWRSYPPCENGAARGNLGIVPDAAEVSQREVITQIANEIPPEPGARFPPCAPRWTDCQAPRYGKMVRRVRRLRFLGDVDGNNIGRS